jgi:hypothetical protein
MFIEEIKTHGVELDRSMFKTPLANGSYQWDK